MVLTQRGRKENQVWNTRQTQKWKDSSVVSRVIKQKNIDPLTFFSAANTIFAGERFFWTNPSMSMILVGLGKEIELEVDGDHSTHRFQEVEEDWSKIIKNITGTSSNPYGTGPMLFGGFSFDPKRQKTDLWNDYPSSKFVLPTILLSIINGECYLTYNLLTDNIHNSEDEMSDLTIITDSLMENHEFSFDESPIELVKSEVDPRRWMDSVDEVAYDIQKGLVEKVVLAREIRLSSNEEIQVEHVLARLKEEQPMSYIFAFESGDACFIGASPERLVKKTDDEIKSTCLAGSTARGKTIKEDEKLGTILLNDNKNLIEHNVVVSMIKEEMLDSCESITATEKPQLLKMRDIQHLYTPIKGKAKEGVTLFSMVKKLHPTPALGGFPKDRALEKIREVELLDRGWYASPIGWIDAKDNGEFAVAIRSGLIKGNEVSLFAGCGIVGDSNSLSEYKETNIKFKPMLSALGGTGNDE